MDYYEELYSIIRRQKPSKERFNRIKIRLCKKHNLRQIPTDIDISLHASPQLRKRYRYLLSIKPTREHSGVSVIALMTRPYPCPHGKCDICPGGPKSHFGNVPQSYTGKEPATRRAIRNDYDPYLQMFNRLEQYIAMNKIPSKAELIIMGGTFPSFPKSYQRSFILYAFKAMNDFSSLFFPKGRFCLRTFKQFFELPGDINDKSREDRIKRKLLMLRGKSDLDKEHKKNETSYIRCVGLTIETRPDYAKKRHINFMLELGCTRVELGVQSTSDRALKAIHRGHKVSDSIKATHLLKDMCLKVNYHIMPGLPGVTLDEDLENFVRLFANNQFRPDMLKIYPCMVLKGTKIYKLWKKNKFKPLTTQEAVNLICEFKQFIPPYVRVMRIQRDIPTFMTQDGVDRTNLRQLVDKELKKRGTVCECIRCREIKNRKINLKNIRFTSMHYSASGGSEFFIQCIYRDSLVGFCRLRFPSSFPREEITKDTALIRELHVYGNAQALGIKGESQHRGIGKKLLEKAQKTARTYYKNKMVIISAVGTREYYRKLGFRRQGPYMVKKWR